MHRHRRELYGEPDEKKYEHDRVDGAIHRAAGPELLEACRKLGGCPTGSARITPGFNLPANFVIHAVGPRYRDGRHGEAEQLASCYREALRLAADYDCGSVAFAAISCGIYGYPLEDAAAVSIGAVAEWLADRDLPRNARWVLFDERSYRIFVDNAGKLKAQ